MSEVGVRRGRFRFEDDAVEASYVKWAAVREVPLIRIGMMAALSNYTLGLASSGVLNDWQSNRFTVVSTLVLMCACAGGWWLTHRPSVYPRLATYGVGLNLVIGLHAVYVTQRLLGRADVSLGSTAIVAFAGAAVFRMKPLQALVVVGSYFAYEEILLFSSYREGRLPGTVALLIMALPVMIWSTCVLVSFILDRLSRDAFAQEKIIASQRETIERLLKQEISYQVAERSRALGETLARVDATLPSVRLEPGQTFDSRYRVVRRLGAGGMGAVFEVERLTDRQHLALKVVTGNVTGAQAARFAREAEIGARLRHPNLVQIVDVGVSAAGAPFLVMELVDGGGLEGSQARYGDRQWAVPVLRQIADGLAALHQAGVVHRDLKPANILLSGADEAPLARISDFGISRLGLIDGAVDPLGDTAGPSVGLKGHSLTKTGAIIGTPLYMAPEAARGGQHVDTPADVFAFGIVAHELLTGRLPFEAPVVLEVMAGRPPSSPSPLSGPLGPLVTSCLSLEPTARPRIGEVCVALGRS